MKKLNKNLTIILLLTLLSSCGKTTQKDNVSLNEKRQKLEYSFSEYSEKIPLVTLPLNSNCETGLEGSLFGFTNNEISKFGKADCSIYGKLADNDKYTAIIYLITGDIILPIIVTTDKKGKKISELELYDGYCGEEETFNEISFVSIDKNLTIQLKDSSTTYKRDDKIEIIESTRKTTVKHRQFYINDNGKIVERK